MTVIFYLILVWLSEQVTFSWIWLIVALFLSGSEAKKIYKFTTDPRLEGKEVK